MKKHLASKGLLKRLQFSGMNSLDGCRNSLFRDLSNDAGEVGTKQADLGTLAPGQDSTVNLPYLGAGVTSFKW